MSGLDPERRDVDASGEQVLLTWPARVRVLTNPMVWAALLLAGGCGALVVGMVTAIASRSLAGLLLGAGVLALFLGLFVVIGLVVDLCGGFRVVFALTTAGVRSASGKGARSAAATAAVGGALAGNLAAAGAGLLAAGEQDVFIPYQAVTRVKVSEGRRYVLVKGGFGDKPIGLYCTAETLPQVVAELRQRCPGAAFSGAAVPL